MEIEISQTAHTILDKYCNNKVRPARMPLVIERILEPFYCIVVKQWNIHPNMIQKLAPTPEKEKMKVNIHSGKALEFLTAIDKINIKFEKDIDPCAVASWLIEMFAKATKMEELSKYKPDMGGFKKS